MLLNLDDRENAVYEGIKKYLERKRAIRSAKVISYLNKNLNKRQLNLNLSKIRQIIEKLKEKNVIVEGYQLTKEDIFAIPKRKNIYHYIIDNPGVYAYQITRDLDVSSHVVIWHLQVLKDFEFITSEQLDNHEVYFDTELDLNEVTRHYYMRKGKCKKILEVIDNSNGGMSKTRLAKTLNMHPNTIKKYLTALENIGVISKKKISNKTLYHK